MAHGWYQISVTIFHIAHGWYPISVQILHIAPLVQCVFLCGIRAEIRELQIEAPLELSDMDR